MSISDNIGSLKISVADIIDKVCRNGGYIKTDKYFYFREIEDGVLRVLRLSLERPVNRSEVLYYERIGAKIIE